MRFNNQGGLEKAMFNNSEKPEPKSIRPKNMADQSRIQRERDFLIAKALDEGKSDDIIKINNLPDEHFQRIIETREKNK